MLLLKKWDGSPIVLAGDFNSTPDVSFCATMVAWYD
jgi:endonuclease/exonuclease/phosphatase family metal-dependent hydrolase